MSPTLILALVTGGIELMRQYLNKPPGWTPTQADIDDFNAQIDAATPEAVKAEARARLGLPPV